MRQTTIARVPFFVGVAALTAVACSSFEAASESADGGDAASAEDAATSDVTTADGTAGCTKIVDHDFSVTPVDGRWLISGEATVGAGGVVLTNHQGDKAGAIHWNDRVDLTHLRVMMDIDSESSTDGGAIGGGIAFAWTSTTPTIGSVGNNFGVCKAGVSGYAVVYDSSEKLVQVYGTLATCEPLTPEVGRDLRGSHTLAIDLATTRVSVATDANLGDLRVTLTPPGPTMGYFGVSAATGQGDPGRHVLRRLRVERCPP